ncbi:MFS transporter [Cryptosporangium sp. NPDC051539]|uniref:MFS transporter n=1 Tax=Cryptosporangium sp. NPDC051539 TaxID=3363962 RepID=UPI00378B46A3
MPEALLTTPTGARRRTAGMPQLILLLAGSCLSILGAVLIAPVLPAMTDHFEGVSGVDVLVPIVLTIPALLIGVMAPFAGLIADAIDRKRVLIAAMIAYAIVGTAPLYLNSLGLIIGSRALVGLCEAAIMTCCTTLIADYWDGPQRSRYLGLQVLVAAVAGTVFLGVGGALGGAGWRAPFWLYLVALVLAVPMALFIWQPARPALSARSASSVPSALSARRARPDPSASSAGGGSAKPVGTLPSMPWRELLTPCLVTVVGGVVFYALIVELSFVLDDAGVTSTAAIGGLSALASIATATGAGMFGRLAHRSARQLLPVTFGLSAVGFAVAAATDSVVVIMLGAVIAGAGTGLMLPTLLTWAVNRLRFDQRGRGTGLWTGTLFLGEFLAPLLIAGLSAGAGGLRPALGVLAVVAVAFAVLTVLVVPRSAGPLNVTAEN